jgi:hypothetical protein
VCDTVESNSAVKADNGVELFGKGDMVQSDFAMWTTGWDLNLCCGLLSEGVGSDSAL